MGCFLTVTSRDFAQLSSSLKAGVSVVGASGSSEIKIQVHSTYFRSAREMASLIQKELNSSKATVGNSGDSSHAVSTKQRMQHQVATLSQISPALVDVYFKNITNEYRAEAIRFGKKEAEPMAAKILEQSNYLNGAKKISITQSTGVDIAGSSNTNTNVVVEVKSSGQEKDFGKMMSEGAYEDETHPDGRRQMSDSWLRKVSPETNIEKTNILGVHINPLKETVTIFRRIDSEAKHWKPLMTKPLSDFDLDKLGK